MKEKLKNTKGITLIALIITIIILLILAMVSIKLVINDGIIKKAQEATRITAKDALKEELDIIIAAMNLDIVENNDQYVVSQEDSYAESHLLGTALTKLEEHFSISDNTIIAEENDGTKNIRYLSLEKMYEKGLISQNEDETIIKLKVPCKYKENDINIIVELKANENSIAIKSFALETITFSILQTGENPTVTIGENIKQLTEEGVPIPKGFYYVTGTRDTGVVISDNSADENNASGNNGNQFVWVPVKTNPKLNITIDSLKRIKEVKILSTNGYAETIKSNSDYFEKEINLTDNEPYEVIITYADGSVEDKIYDINSVYKNFNYPITGMMNMIKLLKMQLGSEEQVYDYMKDYVLNNKPEAVLNTKIDIIREFANQTTEGVKYKDSAIETQSVLKYGGFYIGRYEAGTDATTQKGKYPEKNITFENAKSKAEAIYQDKNMYGVKSGILSGVAWDRTMQWLMDTGTKSWEDIFISSTWGNYNTDWHGGRLASSGFSDSYSANNIYDLAGNLNEWSTTIEEVKGGNVKRGNDHNSGQLSSAFGLSVATSASDEHTGYRLILYFYE